MSTLSLHPELRDPLEQLVAVQRPLAQEQQERGLDVALDARAHVPMAWPDEPAASGARMTVAMHRKSV